MLTRRTAVADAQGADFTLRCTPRQDRGAFGAFEQGACLVEQDMAGGRESQAIRIAFEQFATDLPSRCSGSRARPTASAAARIAGDGFVPARMQIA